MGITSKDRRPEVDKDFSPGSESVPDPRLLSNLILQLNISRRQVAGYPEGHPLILSSLEKVLDILEHLLLSCDRLRLGVARDHLVVGGNTLDKRHPVYSDFAKVLFNHDIIAVTFQNGLSRDELIAFLEILNCRKEQLKERGGIARVWSESGIRHIQVEEVDYGFFRITEKERLSKSERPLDLESTSIWERFVQGLNLGTLDPAGKEIPSSERIDPEILAGILNARPDTLIKEKTESYDDAIISFLKQLDNTGIASKSSREMINRLCSFVGNLNRELRRQFLKSTFNTLSSHQSLAEAVIPGLPEDLVLEALEEINARQSDIPPAIMGLMQQWARNSSGDRKWKTVAGGARPGQQDMKQQLRSIFQEEHSIDYVPEAYRNALQKIVTLDRLEPLPGKEVEAVRKALLKQRVEKQFSAVILEIARSDPDENQRAGVLRNLLDLCGYFLEIGDFASLGDIFSRLSAYAEVGEISSSFFREARTHFESPEFVAEVLDGVDLWGKEKSSEIRSLVGKVGEAFAGPLLERLAAEPSLPLRRYYLNCVQDLGARAREAVIARLGDGRWYFVRNLVIILRNLDDPEVLRYIRRFIIHSHPRVHQEVLRTFLHFKDPQADQVLLEDLESSDRERLLNAVQLAEFCRNPEVLKKLLGLLQRSGSSDTEFEIKIAVVRSLGRIGDPEAFPVLERVIRGKYFLRPNMQNRLKSEIFNSLVHYPTEWGIPFLESLIATDQEGLAIPTAETLGRLREKRK